MFNQITPLAIVRDLECLSACCFHRAESYGAHPSLQLHVDLQHYSSSLSCNEHMYIPSFRLYPASSLAFPATSVSIRHVGFTCMLFSVLAHCSRVPGVVDVFGDQLRS
jgi:hypothetical protein